MASPCSRLTASAPRELPARPALLLLARSARWQASPGRTRRGPRWRGARRRARPPPRSSAPRNPARSLASRCRRSVDCCAESACHRAAGRRPRPFCRRTGPRPRSALAHGACRSPGRGALDSARSRGSDCRASRREAARCRRCPSPRTPRRRPSPSRCTSVESRGTRRRFDRARADGWAAGEAVAQRCGRDRGRFAGALRFAARARSRGSRPARGRGGRGDLTLRRCVGRASRVRKSSR